MIDIGREVEFSQKDERAFRGEKTKVDLFFDGLGLRDEGYYEDNEEGSKIHDDKYIYNYAQKKIF